MPDLDDSAGPADDSSARPTDAPPPRPRWVKTSAIVVGSLLVLFLLLQVTGVAGQHGPSMHGG